jgi:hypothetical protein
MDPTAVAPGWADLPAGAKTFRLAHFAWGAANMAALGHVWLSAARRTRGPWLAAAMAAEAVKVV